MARYYRKKTTQRTEQERGLQIKTVKREAPDLELLARVIVEMAMEDPLGLGTNKQPQPSK